MHSLFLSGTGTNVGKTHYAALLLKAALTQGYSIEQLAYYKPIQCGSPTDCKTIETKLPGIQTYCSYGLSYPASPDYAAKLDGVIIKLEKIKEDFTKIKNKHRFIIVEGAGGLAVPINKDSLVSCIALSLNLPLVLILGRELGTINHSLLSIEHARSKGLEIKGIIVNSLGENDDRAKASIESIKRLGRVEEYDLCLSKN